ncbi:hypothetical protein DC083_08975 [Ignatzschineria ureiclastica]|uniref:Transposase n=1 Tax=Ignatzschineria ureiclastica TaxID=472582 RepID=A0A2U2ACU1_9GAMM|nr:hypothetical protein DC083_08975 [Ignatzschineria ureiclastica]GGZ99531.1 hypothetical protein GCM10007162_14600 [Ignatzschineria ureiclastica]
MKKSKFTDTQIMSILKQNESGVKVTDLCREYGISSATFYKWRSKYGGMDASMITRLKELKAENARLKISPFVWFVRYLELAKQLFTIRPKLRQKTNSLKLGC